MPVNAPALSPFNESRPFRYVTLSGCGRRALMLQRSEVFSGATPLPLHQDAARRAPRSNAAVVAGSPVVDHARDQSSTAITPVTINEQTTARRLDASAGFAPDDIATV